jgi:hypothetical protein
MIAKDLVLLRGSVAYLVMVTGWTRVVEPGEIGVAVGGASDQLPLRGSFTLYGPVRAVGPGRVLDTPAETFAQ